MQRLLKFKSLIFEGFFLNLNGLSLKEGNNISCFTYKIILLFEIVRKLYFLRTWWEIHQRSESSIYVFVNDDDTP